MDLDAWRRAAAILLDVSPDAVSIDAAYAANLVPYILDAPTDAHEAEYIMRPAMTREEVITSQASMAFGEPDADYRLPREVRELMLVAIP